jgi:hypothetical protein
MITNMVMVTYGNSKGINPRVAGAWIGIFIVLQID